MGSYSLIERLGAGGMGEVWLARHQLLARPAAVKIVREASLGGGEDGHLRRQRFAREAQATSELQSPHTVQLYDFGITDGGGFYYVMERLRGMDLKRMVERHGPLAPERVVFLLKQACLSLSEAHALGLVHRDIKPANLFRLPAWIRVRLPQGRGLRRRLPARARVVGADHRPQE